MSSVNFSHPNYVSRLVSGDVENRPFQCNSVQCKKTKIEESFVIPQDSRGQFYLYRAMNAAYNVCESELFDEFNKIENFRDWVLKHAVGIRTIMIVDKGLTELPGELFLLNDLESLVVNKNQIREIPSNIGKLTKLRFFEAAQNQIEYVAPEINNLLHLEELYLCNNRIEGLPSLTNPKLTTVSLKSNKLKDFSAKSLPTCVTDLNLSKNTLMALPDDIERWSLLVNLNASGNCLSRLPTTISKLSNLVVLEMNMNQFTEFPTELEELLSKGVLVQLYMNTNQMREIPRHFPESMVEFSVKNNCIAKLPSIHRNNFKLDLTGNPCMRHLIRV